MSYSVETFPNRPDWLKGRQTGCGASDGAAIAGLSGFQSAYSIWVDKTEPVRDEPMDEIQRWGLILQPVIMEEFFRASEILTFEVEPCSLYRSKERPHIYASLDAITDEGEPVELKTAHFASAKVWKTEVPIAYLCQVQHQIYVTGADCGYIAVLKDGYEFAWHRVPRHQKFIDRLMKRLDHFWNEHVVKRTPPPTDYHTATTQALLRKFPASNGKCIELPPELETLVAEYDELTANESAAKRRKDEIKNLLKEKIGENQYGTFLSGSGFQWAGENERRTFRRAKRCPEPTTCDA